MTETVFRAYTGVALAFLFSIAFLYLLIKTSKSHHSSFGLQISLVFGLVISVALVGDAEYVSLVQGVVISLGCLGALIYQITRTDRPDVRVIRLLIASMIITLLLGQAARSFRIGILDWFQLDVGKEETLQSNSITAVDLDELSAKLDRVTEGVSQQSVSALLPPEIATQLESLSLGVKRVEAGVERVEASIVQQPAQAFPTEELEIQLKSLSSKVDIVSTALSQLTVTLPSSRSTPSNEASDTPPIRRLTVTVQANASEDIRDFGLKVIVALRGRTETSVGSEWTLTVLSIPDSTVLLQTEDEYSLAGRGWKCAVDVRENDRREYLLFCATETKEEVTFEIIALNN